MLPGLPCNVCTTASSYGWCQFYVYDVGAICCLVFPVMYVLLPLVMDGEQFRCLM